MLRGMSRAPATHGAEVETGRFATRTSAGDVPPEPAGLEAPRRPPWVDALLLLAVGVLLIAATVNALTHGVHGGALAPRAHASSQRHTHAQHATRTKTNSITSTYLVLPTPLRQEGGLLWWSTQDCTAGWFALGIGRVYSVPGRHCRVWPAPNGYRTLLSSGRGSDLLQIDSLVSVKQDGSQVAVPHTAGLITGDLAWSPDGAVVAGCVRGAKGPVLDLLYPDGPQETPGACLPAWTGAGYLVTTVPSPPEVRVGRHVVLSQEQAAALLPSAPKPARLVLSAVSAAGDRIAVALIALDPTLAKPLASTIAVLSADGRVVFRLSLGRELPSRIGLSHDGSAIWYLDATDGLAELIRIKDDTRLPQIGAHLYAWSPDGRYLATATDHGLLITKWPGGWYVATLPIAASDLSWSKAA